MKLIQAVIRPEKLDPVKDALVAIGINGLTVTSVQGFGQQLGHAEMYRGVKVDARFLSKVMLTTIVNDDKVDAVIEAIKTSARTGQVGDGKIVVLPVETTIRIRTGESGEPTVA
ncbi:P-II family nitrogen regulator [Cyanobium sp. ATX 6A2]|uniref:P-II family nitrogen regulator n=1 Tax=Cyanobium sp. ATX 6A2 TaxID=2823700 RepID=UPI0020CBC496|nr:P-II family nitrogen regulator [Cyanobium sp. ATX 6A2]MCP9888243.1 P-II family nitrogen regulator [Cyanobium sp. ATX 6A2]